MQKLNQLDFTALCHDAKLINGSKAKPLLLYAPDNKVIKLIYKKHFANAFINNALKLNKLNISSISIINAYKYPAKNCSIVVYSKISGIAVKNAINTSQDLNKILTPLARFIAHFHNSGVFFGDIHLNNILQQKNGDFALIDIQSIKIKTKPLSIRKRISNLEKLIREEIDTIPAFGLTRFLELYLAASTLITRKQDKLCFLLKKRLAKFGKKTQQLAAKLAFLNTTSRVFTIITSLTDQYYIEIQRPQILGKPLNTLIDNNPKILENVAKFMVYLHDHGVFIGRWGFNSILQQENGNFAFLDITRITIQNSPLSIYKRAKELSRIINTHYMEIKNFGITHFLDLYMSEFSVPKSKQSKLYNAIQKNSTKKYRVSL